VRAAPSSPVAAARAAPSSRPRTLLQAAVDDGAGLGVLPRAARLHRSADFTEVVRSGRRASRSTLTVHLLADGEGAPRAGLVVSKAVGGSVVRSTVSRRLRHLLRDRLGGLPAGSRLVVRAAPAAATASSAVLGDDLDRALARAQRPSGGRS
jgi:ribonuclease P protein component